MVFDKLSAVKLCTDMNLGLTKTTMLLLLLLYSASCQVFPSDSAGGISCFQCHSVNNSDPACHDPFNSSLFPQRTSICMEGRRDHRGTYPGRYCFKLKGIRASDGVEVVVRRCSVDTLVENALKSHYGYFKIVEGVTQHQFFGTVSMCRFDGCNSASTDGVSRLLTMTTTAVLLMSMSRSWMFAGGLIVL